MIPKGVKVYGPGRMKAKAGQELPVALKNIKGIDDKIKKAGDNFEKKSIKKKKIEVTENKPVENQFLSGDKK